MLNKLIDKKRLVIIGINSGTSTDALDLAAVEIHRNRKKYTCRFLEGNEVKLPHALRSQLIDIADNPSPDMQEMMYLDNLLGEFIGQKASLYIKKLHKRNIKVDAIASHGQTIRHLPKPVVRLGKKIRGTLQIGSADFIAAKTGLPVIADYRQADVALGNEGAPITTGAVHRLFAHKNEPRLIINVGGMSNFFFLPVLKENKKIMSKDCGPGNILSDLISKHFLNIPFDKNGANAKKGTVSQRLLNLLLSNTFYTSKEDSTGRESFGKDTLELMITFSCQFNLTPEDLLATAVECTCRSIQISVSSILKKEKKLKKLYLTGGGRKNIFLRKRLQQLLPETSVSLIDDLGINGDYIEAVSYAVLGEALLRSEPIHPLSGKNGLYPLLGKIILPPVKKEKG